MALTPTGVEFLAKGLTAYLRDLEKADKAQLGLGKSADKAGGMFGKLGSALGGTAKIAAGVAVAGVGALVAGVGALATVSTTTAISFEDAFAGVIKTTDGLTSGIGELNEAGKDLRAGFVDLTKEIPLTFEELAAIGELGGQLGIGKDALLDFTETVAALGVSTNLSTEEAATGLARITNIFNISADDMGSNIEQLGSTIVALGNNFATTERDILAFGERLAGAGAIAGLSQADVLAIGTAMSSVGVEAEAGGTAVQKVLLSINNAVAGAATGFVDYSAEIDKNVDKLTKLNAESARLEAQFPGLQDELLAQEQAFIAAGGSAEEFGRQLGDKTRQKAFETAKAIQELQTETDLLRQQHGQPIDSNLLATFAQTSGMTADEFKQLWQDDASEAFRLFVEGLGAQGDDAVNTLADLGLEDQRLIRSFLSLAGAGDLLEQALLTANTAFEENTALANEAAQRYATTKSQIAIFKNTLRALADTIGTRLLPFVGDLIALGISFASDFAGPLTDALDNQIVPALENAISFVTSWIDAFRSGQADFQTVIDAIVASVTAGWPLVEAQLTIWGNQFWNWITDTVIPNASTQITSIATTVAGYLTTQWTTTILPALTTWGNQFWNWIVTALVDGPGKMAELTGFIGQEIRDYAPKLIEAHSDWATKFWEWTNTAVDMATQALIVVVAEIIRWAGSPETQAGLKDAGFAIGQFLGEQIGNFGDNGPEMVKVLGKIIVGLVAAVSAVSQAIVGLAAQIVAGIVAGLLDEIGIQVEPATISELTSVFQGIGENVKTIAKVVGTNIIEGIKNGIKQAQQDLENAITETANDLINSFKETLGIASPSTVFYSFGADLIQGLIDGIGSLAGQAVGAVTGVFSSLFGGGEEESAGPTIDTAGPLASFQSISAGLLPVQEQWTAFVQSILDFTVITLPLLQDTFTLLYDTLTEQILALKDVSIMPLDSALINIYTLTLPTLQTTATDVINAIMTLINQTTAAVHALASAFTAMGESAARAAEKVVDDMEDAADAIDNLIEIVEKATEAFEKMAEAAREAATAAKDAGSSSGAQTGIGFKSGVGFMRGIGLQGGLGLGYTIPGQGRGDTFGPMFLEPGEELLVTPRGMTIDSLVMDRLAGMLKGGGDKNNTFNMTVNTLSNPQAVIQQYQVAKALIG